MIFNKKIPLLLLLVAMIFVILLISMAISGVVGIILFNLNIIQGEHRLILLVLYMLLVSLFTGTILARIGGERFLRQIYDLAEATKEVASGNFKVRMKTGWTKEVDLISLSFNEMVKELSNIETLRGDFVSNISHEFKTPITSIRGFAKHLKSETLSDEQRNEYLDIIISESERLTRLSNNVLLLSRLESTGKVTEENEYSLDEQIRRTILLLEPQLRRKQLEVSITLENIRIHANEEMLSHLWINLLGNAIKFSPDGGEINVALKSSEGDACVTVSDKGAGMDDETKRRIFDKFYQGDQSRAAEGNGLGLSLVKRILELENGKIKVQSELGKGSSFTVSLPIQQAVKH
ncbi:MAG: HAMP domain-containing histidine kinase [Defluviitaleaceae bacterium]|nr:HAMP domain-containing histidine kinase [Defluviitaleaceae bacterium]